jgi:hypothetical protein
MQKHTSSKAVTGISKAKFSISGKDRHALNANAASEPRIAYTTPEVERRFRECLLACHVSRRVCTPHLLHSTLATRSMLE